MTNSSLKHVFYLSKNKSENGMNETMLFEKNILDLSGASTPVDILLEINIALEKYELKNKTIEIFIGDISLSSSHILSIKSVLESVDVKIKHIYSNSTQTQLAALSSGLSVSEFIAEKTETNNSETEQKPVTEEITASSETNEKIIANPEKNIVIENKKDEFDPENGSVKTLHLKQNLRSGQNISYNGNIVIIGHAHAGSEIVASGDITVWGILSGIAHAGAKGYKGASIRALKINAIQLRIADVIARRPDRIDIKKIEKANTFTPEEAKVSNGEIKISHLNN